MHLCHESTIAFSSTSLPAPRVSDVNETDRSEGHTVRDRVGHLWSAPLRSQAAVLLLASV